MDKYLSPIDVQQIAGRAMKVMKYSDLVNYKKLEDIFERNIPGVLLLYETKLNMGHWVMLLKYKDRIEFFDSYALLPDDQLKFTTKQFKRENNMDVPVMTWLMLYSKFPIEYNHFPFQKWSKNIATCGRWCGYRYKMYDMDLEEFIEMFEKIPKSKLDKTIVELTEN